MDVSVRVLQRNRTNRIYMDICKRRFIIGMAPVVMEAERFNYLLSVS